MSEIIPFKRREPAQDLMLGFLNSPGHKRDADFYLGHFLSYPPETFAMIALDEDVLRAELDTVLFEIRYLLRLGLFPVVLLQSTDAFLEKMEIENYFKRARLTLNFMSPDLDDEEKLEFVRKRASKGLLPLIHVDPDKNIFKEVWKHIHILKTRKLFFLRKEGGLCHTETRELISMINLNAPDTQIKVVLNLSEEEGALFKNCENLVRKAQHPLTVSVVSPGHLLRELLTVKGAGTLIHAGTQILAHKDWTTVDRLRLAHLIQTQTQAQLDDTFFSQPMVRCYVEEEYRGAAVLQSQQGLDHLRYFCVGVEARGLGIGSDLWNQIVKNHPKIFWRNRTDDFITRWYEKQCAGMHRIREWTVFWKGLDPHEISPAITAALKGEDSQ
jgi:hypothetical protein